MKTLVRLLALVLSGCCALRAPAQDHDVSDVSATIAPVAPRVLELVVRDGRVEYGERKEIDADAGDVVDAASPYRFVRRDGVLIGALVGTSGTAYQTYDVLHGGDRDARALDAPATYTVSSPDDARYAAGVAPTAVHRKSRPSDLGWTGGWRFAAPVEHRVYLELPAPLVAGKRYRIACADLPLAPLELLHDPRAQRSEAVHVSQIGFRPDDPVKVAFLSCWMGNGGALAYPEGLAFTVIRDSHGRTVLAGKATRARAHDEAEDAYGRNHCGTDVHELDFSALRDPGTYRVAVEGVGCSFPFRIDPDAWRDAFTLSARGALHQRSGIALGPPWTEYRRPRCFHPADGVRVYASTARLMDTGNGFRDGDRFTALVRGKTDAIVPDAFGGTMDAGDWDRRIQHLELSRLLLELALLFPRAVPSVTLRLPDARDDRPDVVTEALWNVDFYRRLQTEDGGVRGGIESQDHPRFGERSWEESQTVLAYAPDPWCSYLYAATAARAASVLRASAAAEAAAYQDSALRAMRWAEHALRDAEAELAPVRDARNLAAVELYRLTDERAWHDAFLRTTAFADSDAPLAQWQHHDQGDAAFVYLQLAEERTDPDVRAHCRAALLREADERAAQCARTGYRWTADPRKPLGAGALSTPDGVTLARAHALTGDAKYLRALVLCCQTGAGANPLNLCYTTGAGARCPQHPLHVDARLSHQAAPPGITVLGPLDPKGPWGKTGYREFFEPACEPPFEQWPALECFFDIYWFPMMCEYTVHTTIARNAYVWGYLALRG